MSSYDIGISGIKTAQTAIDVIGNNMANSGTEGYHRQTAALAPQMEVYQRGNLIGQGVEVSQITRMYSGLLETEITNQQSVLSMAQRQLDTLEIIENTFGELASEGLSTAMDNYFEAMNEMSTEPTSAVLQNKVIRAAEQLTYEFQRMGTFLTELESQLVQEADIAVDQVNIVADQIAKLNLDIKRVELQGDSAGNMRDERDSLVNQLAELIDVQVYEDANMYNVTVGQIPLVIGAYVSELTSATYVADDGVTLAIAPAGTEYYTDNFTGGQLGAVLSLHNDLVRDIHDKLDTLANSIITETNKYHIQGVGSNGSFENLAGWVLNTDEVSEMVPQITDGSVYVRVIDSDGNASRYEIEIDVENDTFDDIAAKFNAIDGLSNCGVIGSKFTIQSDPGYTFDFQAGIPPEVELGTPPILATPEASQPQISGIYTGDINQNYTCTIQGDGNVGVTDDLRAVVTNESGQVIATYNIGKGYEAGSKLYIDNGISVSFGPGELNDSGAFNFKVLADSDTSGFLASTGINCLFSGDNASTMGIRPDIAGNPEMLAVSGGGEKNNGSVILQMVKVGDTSYSDLIGLTPEQFYQNLASNIGQEVASAEMKMDNANNIKKNLNQQRDDISGADINTEAIQLLVYERMFQAMSQFMNTISKTMETIMSIVE